MSEQKRRHERVASAIAFSLEDGTTAVTRDISPSGVYFEADGSLAVGTLLRFDLGFDSALGGLLVRCVARVVRVKQEDGKTGVGAEIIESRLERKEPASDQYVSTPIRSAARVR